MLFIELFKHHRRIPTHISGKCKNKSKNTFFDFDNVNFNNVFCVKLRSEKSV